CRPSGISLWPGCATATRQAPGATSRASPTAEASTGIRPAPCWPRWSGSTALGDRPGALTESTTARWSCRAEPPSTSIPPAGPPRRPLENQAMDPRRESTGASASDAELVLHYKSTRDPVIVGTLFERYAHLALAVSFRYLRQREDAEDAVMEVYEHLLT